MLNQKNTIVFDFDGTLVDTMQIFADVASSLIAEYFKVDKQEARDMYLKTSGLPFCSQLESMFPGHKLNAHVVSLYETQKLDATQDIRISDASFEALNLLKNYDYDLVVSSNNFQHNIDNFIINNNLEELFTLALGYKDGFSKGRDHFEHIKQELGTDNERMLFIGDSLNDFKLANENGIDFIGKLGTFSHEDFRKVSPEAKCITSISELL